VNKRQELLAKYFATLSQIIFGAVILKQFSLAFILNELEFAITPDVSNPDMYKGWSCKLIQHRDNLYETIIGIVGTIGFIILAYFVQPKS
jgi:hypothetical protein